MFQETFRVPVCLAGIAITSKQRSAIGRRAAIHSSRGRKAGQADLAVHPHMLRHAAGYCLANQGVDTRLIRDFLDMRTSATRHITRHFRRRGWPRFASGSLPPGLFNALVLDW